MLRLSIMNDFDLSNEGNIEYVESKNVQSTSIEVVAESKLSYFSKNCYAIERILHCKNLDSNVGFDQEIEGNVEKIVVLVFKCMHLREWEYDKSVTDMHKVESPTERYYATMNPKCENEVKKKMEATEMEKEKAISRIIERESIVEIMGWTCCFVVIDIGNKYHNKWFPVWPSEK